jgi:hypothetical protein
MAEAPAVVPVSMWVNRSTTAFATLELLAALGSLELVRQRGERGEPYAPSLLAGADRERCRQLCVAAAGFTNEHDPFRGRRFTSTRWYGSSGSFDRNRAMRYQF